MSEPKPMSETQIVPPFSYRMLNGYWQVHSRGLRHISDCAIEDDAVRLVGDLNAAIAAARAEGRREGMEEAVKIAWGMNHDLKFTEHCSCLRNVAFALEKAAAFREAKEKVK